MVIQLTLSFLRTNSPFVSHLKLYIAVYQVVVLYIVPFAY
ncbi:hypothetical protein LX64_03522 [Chitinophaga skermanii]|uniref:Uncharacterized protein n=1 Tax=Chitinophaga skermanii TaxID=331697 RepID=A0A327QGP5_9BACT|nr:hypothetical protein LX64_03522 [Chitinophaga skermanii]